MTDGTHLRVATHVAKQQALVLHLAKRGEHGHLLLTGVLDTHVLGHVEDGKEVLPVCRVAPVGTLHPVRVQHVEQLVEQHHQRLATCDGDKERTFVVRRP